MNHPSDYMPNYEDSLSSDSSNLTLRIAQRPTDRPTRSFHQTRPQVNNPRTKNVKNNKKTKNTQTGQQKARAVSDYLILGNSYLSSSKAKELTRRLVEQQREETPRVMRVQRLKRKQQKNIKKIQAYMQTFIQGVRINQIIKKLARSDKLALYKLLLKEKLQQQKEEASLEGYFRMAVQKLEGLACRYEGQFPAKQRTITKWKNYKLHQLSTVKTFLQQPSCDLESQLLILSQQKFFPELKEQAQELSSSIWSHLRQQQQRSRTTTHEDQGVRWVLHRLLKFILEREQIVNSVLQRLQESLTPLLEDALFVDFQREIIGSPEDESEFEQQRWIHIFNKAIFDLVNQAAPELLQQCQYNAVDEVLTWLFEAVTRYEKEERWQGEGLLVVGEAVFDEIIEEVLWELLEYF